MYGTWLGMGMGMGMEMKKLEVGDMVSRSIPKVQFDIVSYLSGNVELNLDLDLDLHL